MRYWIALALGLVFAVAVGAWIGTSNTQMLVLLVAVIVTWAVVAGLRQRAWVLILIGWWFYGNTLLLPIPFSVRDISVMLAVSACIAYRVMIRTGEPLRSHPLGWLVALNVVYLVATFIIHPVGFRVVGSETVGGRPYLNVFFAVLAYWVIVRLPDSVKTVSRLPYFMLVGAALLTLFHVTAYVLPQATPILFHLYSALDLDVYFGSVSPGQEEMGRLKGLMYLGSALMMTLCAYYPPLTMLNPRRWRFYSLLLALGCLLAAGFRNMMLWGVAALGLGAWFQRGWRELAGGMAGAVLLVGVLVAGQGRLYELPYSVQRSLSFLPGQWSTMVATDAENSSQWRFELWRTIIRDRVIKNWWVGDGFGVSQQDLWSLGTGYTDQVLVMGSYHNGPLTAIRAVGIIGLVMLYVLMIGGAAYAVECVKRCRGTILQPAAIFIAIQLVWTPIHYTFVFGDYGSQIPQQIFLLALVRLLIRMEEETRPATVPAASTPTRQLEAVPTPA